MDSIDKAVTNGMGAYLHAFQEAMGALTTTI